VEHVKRLGGMIDLEPNPQLPDAKAVLRRIDSGKPPHVAPSFEGQAIECVHHAVSDFWIESIQIV
jgi:hypothetical protein